MKPGWHQARAYVAAPILIGVAVLIRNALLGKTGGPEPDLLLLAVAIAGALGGFGPAAVATAVGLLEEIYFQTEPVRTFLVPRMLTSSTSSGRRRYSSTPTTAARCRTRSDSATRRSTRPASDSS